MECKICSGLVEWQGKVSNLTHKCLKCGEINSQIIEEDEMELD